MKKNSSHLTGEGFGDKRRDHGDVRPRAVDGCRLRWALEAREAQSPICECGCMLGQSAKTSFACLPKKKGRHKPHLHITYFCGERLASPIAARTSSFGQLKQLQSISSVPSPKRLSEFSPSGSHKAVLQGCGTVTEAHWPLKSAQETTPSPKPLERLYFLQQRHLGF